MKLQIPYFNILIFIFVFGLLFSQEKNISKKLSESYSVRENNVKKSTYFIGKEAPGFWLPTIDNKDFFLSKELTKPLFINFFHTQCLPCLKEIPELQAFYNKHKGVINMVLINYSEWNSSIGEKDTPEKIKRVVKEEQKKYEYKLTIPILFDKHSVASQAYKVRENIVLPVSFLIDTDGIIIWEHRKRVFEEDFNKLEEEYAEIFQ